MLRRSSSKPTQTFHDVVDRIYSMSEAFSRRTEAPGRSENMQIARPTLIIGDTQVRSYMVGNREIMSHVFLPRRVPQKRRFTTI